ncbi:hypothetical protein [Feifania hominis]|uniref:Uncharacterized protein n=1 Tax=Feifania hominis TaxID=2763660 RepID=A0A926DDS4_9FIRM|nr:hypothetical protein [Feifania hominis]MBC8535992.1 hypothetical protein [Feifania hominis]
MLIPKSDGPICDSCMYFRLHYVKLGNSFGETGDGHCVYPRLKLRRRFTKACEHYVPREKDEKKATP